MLSNRPIRRIKIYQCVICDITDAIEETGERVEEKRILNTLQFDIEHRTAEYFIENNIHERCFCTFIFEDTRTVGRQCPVSMEKNYFNSINNDEYTCKIYLNDTDYIHLSIKNKRITFYYNTIWKTTSLSKIIVHK